MDSVVEFILLYLLLLYLCHLSPRDCQLNTEFWIYFTTDKSVWGAVLRIIITCRIKKIPNRKNSVFSPHSPFLQHSYFFLAFVLWISLICINLSLLLMQTSTFNKSTKTPQEAMAMSVSNNTSPLDSDASSLGQSKISTCSSPLRLRNSMNQVCLNK